MGEKQKLRSVFKFTHHIQKAPIHEHKVYHQHKPFIFSERCDFNTNAWRWLLRLRKKEKKKKKRMELPRIYAHEVPLVMNSAVSEFICSMLVFVCSVSFQPDFVSLFSWRSRVVPHANTFCLQSQLIISIFRNDFSPNMRCTWNRIANCRESITPPSFFRLSCALILIVFSDFYHPLFL